MVKPQKPKFLIVVPCYNEEERFDSDYWNNLIANCPSVRFVFVNDGSSDQTLKVIKKASHESTIISLKNNSGKSEAIRRGWLQHISESNWVGYGFIDSDGAFSLGDIQNLITIFEMRYRLDSKIDAILSSRVALAGRKIKRTTIRHYLGRIITTYISYNWIGLPYDTQSGFKLFNKTEYFTEALIQPFKTRWFFDIELLVRLKNFKENELIMWEEPLMSWEEIANSKIRFSEFLRISGEILKVKAIVKKSFRNFK